MAELIQLRGVVQEVDENGRLLAQFVVAGRTRPINGFPKGINITAGSLRDAVAAGFFGGASIYLNHARGSRQFQDLAGYVSEAWFSEEHQAIRGWVDFFGTGAGKDALAVFEKVRDVAREGGAIPDVGFSLDSYFELRDLGNGVVETVAMKELLSVDAVNKPAAEGRILAAAIGEFDVEDETIVETEQGGGAAAGVALAAAEASVSDWMVAVAQTAVPAILQNSGLPQASIGRLGAGSYANPAALNAAIKAERDFLAALEQENVVQLNGRPRRGVTAGDMRTGEDEARDVVRWMFGVPDAPIPAFNMRRTDQVYVALTGDVNFTGVFDPTRVQLSASPVTLPNMAVDAMNVVVAAQFSKLRFWRWYELVALPTPNDGSLHDMKWVTYGGTGNLPVVPDGASYTEGDLGDNKETAAFEKMGRYVGITRKMIKNSDIARIQAVPIALATDSVRTRSSKVSSIFTDNSGTGPTLSDGTVLFHASRNNIATTALGTDTTAWEAASAEIFNHTELGSAKKVATFAKYNLVPSALYFQALKNFGYGDGNPTTYNPFAVADRSPEDPRPVVLPVPDWTDATDWAALADPNVWPVIMMSYSQSPGGGTHPLPELFTATSELAGLMFTNDMLPVKVRDEYAVGVNGGRGISKRNVA